MLMMNNQSSAKMFTDAIRKMTPEQLDNLENYLSQHFDEWLKNYCKTPEDIAVEMKCFSNVEI